VDLEARRKWNAIYAATPVGERAASRVLTENAHLLPTAGRALEVACGTGSDSIFLARHGLRTDAWDISDTIVARLNGYASAHGLALRAAARDVTCQPPGEGIYDVVFVAHFLERSIAQALMRALRPGGLLIYQTFTREATAACCGPSNPAFRLDANELLRLFSGLQAVVYREESLIGDTSRGFRNEAMLIARRTS
jgi:2-polyprenyl-3-methyl-5-hydroxy-6-metoxy-1,4-benzoquinol methylase